MFKAWRTEAQQRGIVSTSFNKRGPGELKPYNRDRLNSPQANTTYPNSHMHAREAHEEEQHAPRLADEGAVTPATSRNRRRPVAVPPARSTATAAAGTLAAVIVLVEHREDEAMIT